jgi:hypothetical protein
LIDSEIYKYGLSADVKNSISLLTFSNVKEEIKPIQTYEIDHVFELNLVRDLFDKMRIGHKSETNKLKNDLKITFNQDFNLALTDQHLNLAKSSAVQSFASDYKNGKANDEGLG